MELQFQCEYLHQLSVLKTHGNFTLSFLLTFGAEERVKGL